MRGRERESERRKAGVEFRDGSLNENDNKNNEMGLVSRGFGKYFFLLTTVGLFYVV